VLLENNKIFSGSVPGYYYPSSNMGEGYGVVYKNGTSNLPSIDLKVPGQGVDI
jgi:hypothetical protein